MRKTVWNISVLITALFLLKSYAVAQGVDGYFDINKNFTKQYEDGERTLSSETLNQNLYLNVQEPITPVLSYQFNIRANYQDSKTTDELLDDTSKRYIRMIEPAIDLMLGNPNYSFNAGARRRERWNAAHTNNDNRTTYEYYYSRFSLLPDALPSLTLQIDRQRNYDYLSDSVVDDSDTVYAINSAYDLPPGDAKFSYTLNYSHTVSKTPLELDYKTLLDEFDATYSIGYTGRFWQNKADYFVVYQGNYSRNKTEQFLSQTGAILNERIPFAGLYVLDDPDIAPSPSLGTENQLVNNNVISGIGSINIGTGINHNIGIWVSPENFVDRLYIYVNQDVSLDINLGSVGNWKVYRSDSNTADPTTDGPWTEIALTEITIVPEDDLNNIYRYEIKFTTAQKASYFKAVNLATVGAPGLTDVFVTEIEAYGIDIVDEDENIDVINFFSQQIGINTNFRPSSKLLLALNYSIDRTEQNMVSVPDSVGGIFENIFSDTINDDDKSNYLSTITRAYSASSTWLAHRFLTTSLRFQRNESFDNLEETDFDTNSYTLDFVTEPLPTLNANLSLTRSDNFSFGDKSSTNDSILLSVGSRLYRDLNMITDIIYTRSHSYENEITSTTQQINGTLDAILTRRVSGTFTYHINWTDSDDTSSDYKDASVYITYRPGRLINLTGNFTIRDAEGDTSTSEGMLLDWLPLPAIRLNVNYQHSNIEPESIRTDTLNGYVIWYLTKFADVRFTNNYTKQVEDTKMENYSMNAILNCRF